MSKEALYMSSVVTLAIEEGIATVLMIDREAKNTFSTELIAGLLAAFQTINPHPDVKVVVICGFDNYFCCGGTQEGLLRLSSGKMTFVYKDFFRLLLDCPMPTIAAMQGHAIGGGLVLGCYADIPILAEECIYSANFMKYGFTPGMGATYIVPKKFGESIGREMLYSAKNYFGSTLKARGVLLEVVQRGAVMATAMAFAKDLALKPRTALLLLKNHLAQQTRHDLPKIIEQELALHEMTFTQPDVRHRITTLFGN